ncbi:MAG TPA: hypothetical protein VEB42_05260 [Chitinophagaceae bacterium]|nr:hypothetical protein [Chitinophagaceae bacterium]
MKNILKVLGLLILISTTSLFILGMKMKTMADDVWKQLGLTQGETNWNINNSFAYGVFYYQGAVNARKIATGDRVGIIHDLAAYAKKYAASDEFKKSYAAYRAGRKPSDPYIIKYNVDSLRNAERARIQADIKATEANVNHPNPKVRNAVPYRLENLKKELASLDEPNSKPIKVKLDNAQRQNDAAMKYYQEQMKKFEAQFPENPQLLIKARLQQMINIISDVDYNAEVSVGKKYTVFVNPEYEKKPKEWKLAFRAGKQATDALKGFAQKWIEEIK